MHIWYANRSESPANAFDEEQSKLEGKQWEFVAWYSNVNFISVHIMLPVTSPGDHAGPVWSLYIDDLHLYAINDKKHDMASLVWL